MVFSKEHLLIRKFEGTLLRRPYQYVEAWLYQLRCDRWYTMNNAACGVLKAQLFVFCLVFFGRWIHTIQQAEFGSPDIWTSIDNCGVEPTQTNDPGTSLTSANTRQETTQIVRRNPWPHLEKVDVCWSWGGDQRRRARFRLGMYIPALSKDGVGRPTWISYYRDQLSLT